MRMRRDEERLVAVAISRDRRSQMAMKWALEHVLIRGQTVRLIHVNQPQAITSSYAVGDNETANRNEPSNQTMDIFLAFRCLCSRKEVPWEAVTLEDQDIAKAIIDYVCYNRIDTLVLGASSRSLTRLFKPDIPSIVLKGVPYFCNVYVIAKGKIISERLALTPLPASSAPPPRRMASVPYRSIDQTVGSIEREEFSVPETEISCISGDRMSTDSTFFDFYDNLGSTLSRAPSKSVGMSMSMSMNSSQYRRSAVSSACKYVDLGSADELPLSNHETTRTSHSPRPSEEVEEKLRKLQLQIKQTMDMYHAACKEALTAKQQARELQHLLKLENERRLEEVEERAKERALQIAEEQIESYKAAIHVSEAAYRKVEQEAQKRKDVEIKALRELEDFKNRMAISSPNYKGLFNIVVVLFLFHFFLF